jgi:hypothetical protein
VVRFATAFPPPWRYWSLLSSPAFAICDANDVRVDPTMCKARSRKEQRNLLGRNLDGICFSSECTDTEAEAMVGRGKPDMHSAEPSLFVLDARIKLIERSDPATAIEGQDSIR